MITVRNENGNENWIRCEILKRNRTSDDWRIWTIVALSAFHFSIFWRNQVAELLRFRNLVTERKMKILEVSGRLYGRGKKNSLINNKIIDLLNYFVQETIKLSVARWLLVTLIEFLNPSSTNIVHENPFVFFLSFPSRKKQSHRIQFFFSLLKPRNTNTNG